MGFCMAIAYRRSGRSGSARSFSDQLHVATPRSGSISRCSTMQRDNICCANLDRCRCTARAKFNVKNGILRLGVLICDVRVAALGRHVPVAQLPHQGQRLVRERIVDAAADPGPAGGANYYFGRERGTEFSTTRCCLELRPQRPSLAPNYDLLPSAPRRERLRQARLARMIQWWRSGPRGGYAVATVARSPARGARACWNGVASARATSLWAWSTAFKQRGDKVRSGFFTDLSGGMPELPKASTVSFALGYRSPRCHAQRRT